MTYPRNIQCPTRKICHWTAQLAQQQIERFKDRGRLRGRMHVYLCPKCGYYHIGHYDPRVVQKHARWKRILLDRARQRAMKGTP